MLGNPPGQHGLTRTGSTHHEHVMTVQRRDFQRSFGHPLPLHIGKNPPRSSGGLSRSRTFLARGCNGCVPSKWSMISPRQLTVKTSDALHQFPFGGVPRRNENSGQAFFRARRIMGRMPFTGRRGAVQGQFSGEHRHGFRQLHILFGCQHSQGNGQIQPGSILLRSAGARFTVMWVSGKWNPEFLMAAFTRSRASFTATSGRPTISKASACHWSHPLPP